MKKIFLVLGLSGICSAAFSQTEEFFNAQKHLQKKTKLGKKTRNKPVVRNFSLPLQKNGAFLKPALSQILPNGDRVFILPADNMPCVSPDMTRYRAMPNADIDIRLFILRQQRAGQIPNPAIPLPPAGLW